MKIIDTQKMIKILQNCDEKELDLDKLDMLLEAYGDEWFIVDGRWQKVVENQNEFIDENEIISWGFFDYE